MHYLAPSPPLSPQNVAKEGLEFADEGEEEKELLEEMETTFKPLTTWLKEEALADLIEKAVVSNRLTESPCALVAGQYGWCVLWGGRGRGAGGLMWGRNWGHSSFSPPSNRSGNMERIMRAQAYSQGKEAE